MVPWEVDTEGAALFWRLLLGVLIGAFCGGIPLAVGLIRGHKSMAWTSFGVCIVLGPFCTFCNLVPAIIFTVIMAVTEPIERRKKKRKKGVKKRRERADDFLDDDPAEERRRRTRGDDDRPRRRRRDEDDDYDDEDDRPSRRR